MPIPSDQILATLRETFDKLERAIQFPTRKDFEAVTQRLADLSKRIEALENAGPRGDKKGPKKK